MIRLRAMAAATALALVAATPAGPAAAQGAPDPHVVTCADLLDAGPDDVARNNVVLSWAVGYMYGRFGSVEGTNLTAERYQQNVSELVGAFRQICPNVPDMTIAAFTRNLANDVAGAVGAP